MPSAMPIDVSRPVCEPGAVVIRPAIEVDLSTIVGIYAHHVCTGIVSFEIDTPDLAGVTRCLHVLQETGMPYMVVETGDALLGYVYAGPYHAQLAYRHTVEDSTYLGTATQGWGVGTLLPEAFIRECQTRDLKQMVAVVGGGRENPGSAKPHARCGFREVGVLETVGYKFGRWLDYLLMQRAL